MRVALVALLAGALGGGCGASPPPAGAPRATVAEDSESDRPDAPCDATLPPWPHGVSVTAPPLAEGLALARVRCALSAPAMPRDARADTVRAFIDGPLRTYMLEEGRALRAARGALAAAEEGTDGEHVVAAALVGVLYLRLAEALSNLALPDAVQSDPSAALALRNALLEAAAPLYDGALSAFGACASSAVGSANPSVEAWGRACDERSARAADAPRPIMVTPRPEEAASAAD